MKQFLAVFLGGADTMNSWNDLPEQERLALTGQGVRAWYAWVERYRDQIVFDGAPLGVTKSIGRSGISDIRNEMSAFMVMRAESHEAAAKLFEGHPHFTLFPGDSIEVMECLPIPENIPEP